MLRNNALRAELSRPNFLYIRLPPYSPFCLRLNPPGWLLSFSAISSIDFLPKLRTFPKSSMVLSSKSAIVLMPARFKQLYARTESSNSSMEIFAGPSSTAGSSLSEPTGSTTIPPSPVFTSTTSAECG